MAADVLLPPQESVWSFYAIIGELQRLTSGVNKKQYTHIDGATGKGFYLEVAGCAQLV
jgi:ligand-binding SRPBCC domain-containing protein